MNRRFRHSLILLCLLGTNCRILAGQGEPGVMQLNDQEYFERTGFNVMVFSDFYPEGHQGGVSIVLHGVRVAANGDLRLEPAPGQWQPIPKLEKRTVDPNRREILARLRFPDEERHLKGFNPIHYPDLQLTYSVRVIPEGTGVGIFVDLDQPLPPAWVGRVGFNLELFPGDYFGRSFNLDGQTGIFPRDVTGPIGTDSDGGLQSQHLARGKVLVVAPESADRQLRIEAAEGELVLIDGRSRHNNGWFIVRTLLPGDRTREALHWRINAETVPGWLETPVLHLSQVGYHPGQPKTAVVETDARDDRVEAAGLYRVLPGHEPELIKAGTPVVWGKFLRYRYLQFDFSEVREPGVYFVRYGSRQSNIFRIAEDIYRRQVWQPSLEYFLPVQMCHMRVNDRYRVWHDLCHLDDARMAPVSLNHFDGYLQGASTLTRFQPGEPVPGLNVGGWHDAGDYDLRVESQIETVRVLTQIWEAFDAAYDATTIDQDARLVELLRPDGTPDVLQQIEHGVLTVLGGYRALGRLYRGIIEPQLRQYTLLGDAAAMTDNLVDPSQTVTVMDNRVDLVGPDDRLVFTEENPRRELEVAAGLAAAARVLRDYRPQLAFECLEAAEALYRQNQDAERTAGPRLEALAELYLATDAGQYRQALLALQPELPRVFEHSGWVLGRVLHRLDDPGFRDAADAEARKLHRKIVDEGRETPFGMPYRPNIWGAGWGIQAFGARHYFLVTGWPEVFDRRYLFDALNFVLGSHPGRDTRSFVSGVGVDSLTVAYGVNRADWSYIPGGVGSGTALIRPDLPELKEWPYFWQQSEYVMGGGGTHFMFLVLAADQLLNDSGGTSGR